MTNKFIQLTQNINTIEELNEALLDCSFRNKMINVANELQQVTECKHKAPSNINKYIYNTIVENLLSDKNISLSSKLKNIKKVVWIDKELYKSISMLKDNGVVDDILFIDIEEEIDLNTSKNSIVLTQGSKKYSLTNKNDEDTIVFVRNGYHNDDIIKFVEQCELIGLTIINEPNAVKVSSNKYTSATLFDENKIKQPKYIYVTSDEITKNENEELDKKINSIYGNDDETNKYVCKILGGHGGMGVFVCNRINILSILQCLNVLTDKLELIIQEYIESEFSGDIRCHVLNLNGQTIVHSCIKRVNDKDFRSNTSLGGEIVEYDFKELSKENQDLVIKTSQISNLVWCGIDLLISKKDGKGYILEINGTPGTTTKKAKDEDDSMYNENFKFYKSIIENINKMCK